MSNLFGKNPDGLSVVLPLSSYPSTVVLWDDALIILMNSASEEDPPPFLALSADWSFKKLGLHLLPLPQPTATSDCVRTAFLRAAHGRRIPCPHADQGCPFQGTPAEVAAHQAPCEVACPAHPGVTHCRGGPVSSPPVAVAGDRAPGREKRPAQQPAPADLPSCRAGVIEPLDEAQQRSLTKTRTRMKQFMGLLLVLLVLDAIGYIVTLALAGARNIWILVFLMLPLCSVALALVGTLRAIRGHQALSTLALMITAPIPAAPGGDPLAPAR
ncbi:hypothetical protein PAPYR_700 [Paratrimastix pyriformis]|uniref:Uncharacterized protein n=1 Tax=Paratrimastix pyriformis TaxID=342808 RepID=A0ABQ8UX45_9EUKA|nr:hypothetical protein PAPYR_700 [Paratrimastix pyriformis]